MSQNIFFCFFLFLLKIGSVEPVDQQIKLVLSYKKKVNPIFVDEEVPSSLNTKTCERKHSQFCDLHHKYIISGDFSIIDNSKLNKLLTRGQLQRVSQFKFQ